MTASSLVTRTLIAALGLALLTVCLSGWAQEGGMDAIVEKCKADLVQRAQVAAADIKLISAENIVWPDSSLGCPEPGKDYTMVLSPGHRVILSVGNKAYEYHTDANGQRVVYCANLPQQGAGGERPTVTPARPPGAQPAGPGVKTVIYALEPIPDEPNLNQKLVARDVSAPQAEPTTTTILDGCTDFTVSETGLVLAKRRTSRSSHELVVVTPGPEPKVLMSAFDFEGLTWLGSGTAFVCLATPKTGATWKVYGGQVGGAPVALDWAPELKKVRGVTVAAQRNLLVITVPVGDDTANRDVTVLDLQARKVVTTFRSAKAVPGILPAPRTTLP